MLDFDACASGLRVSKNRIFGPFCRCIFLPWGEMSARRSWFLFLPMVKLTFEKSDFGALWLYPGTWRRLAGAAPAIDLGNSVAAACNRC